MQKKSKTQKILKSVGKELKQNPPKVLAKTAAKKGAAQAQKQKTAILLSKARKAGAKIKKFNAGAYEQARRRTFNIPKANV